MSTGKSISRYSHVLHSDFQVSLSMQSSKILIFNIAMNAPIQCSETFERKVGDLVAHGLKMEKVKMKNNCLSPFRLLKYHNLGSL